MVIRGALTSRMTSFFLLKAIFYTVSDLLNTATDILNLNWRGGFTIPTSKLYPFQWNWDSGFISLGLGHFNIERAISEMESLFSGQWANGMIPHIIFHDEHQSTYFPNHDFWQTSVNGGAPQKPKTSGITQPAVHGFILECLLNRFPENQEVKDFAKTLFPKIVSYHRFLYKHRDPGKEGLMFIFHPWESGRDNSPLWDESLNRIDVQPGDIPDYVRKDLDIADSAERPTSYQYDRYVYLLELGKKHRYDGPGIAEESPFLIQDCHMNAILIKSNESLIKIGKQFGWDTAELEEWQQQSIQSYNRKLWSEELGMYTGFDLHTQQQLTHKEIGGLVPLYAGIPTKDQAKRLNEYLVTLSEKGYYLCPSFDPESPFFDSKRYWRGPIWPQMNWMLYHGLAAYGFHDTADTVKNDLITLVTNLGFYEYFESQKHLADDLQKGYGGNQFSWTASSIIDLMAST